MNASFLSWQQALEAGAEQCGGKGWNLARMRRLGFNVPDGGVLSSTVYQQLMTDPALDSLVRHLRSIPDHKLSSEETEQCLKAIRQAIITVGLPAKFAQQLKLFLDKLELSDTPLAVRSSATLEDGTTTSFAGIHESYLNVAGIPAIEQAVLDCFASLWTLRAVTYRRKMGIDEHALGCAVVIMALVDARSSGIAFSCDPATGREDITLINANFGLGESVVDGAVEPDEYQLSSNALTLIKRRIGSKAKRALPSDSGGTHLIDSTSALGDQVLAEEQIARLGRLVQRLFWALGEGDQHQDIEWAFDGQKFFLLQARPVTAMHRLTLHALRNQPEIWSNGNFRDAMPMVQHTLGASLLPHNIDVILRAHFKAIGYPAPDGLRFAKLFQGRAYYNASLMQWLYFDSTGVLPAVTNRGMGGHQHEIEIDPNSRGGLRQKLSRGWRTLKLMREMNRHKKNAPARTAQEVKFADTLVHADLTTLSDESIVETFQQCNRRLEAYALPFIMLTSLSGSLFMLIDLLEKYLPGKGTAVANALLAGAGNITSADHGYRLQALTALVEQDSAAKRFFSSEPFSPGAWLSLPETSPFRQAFQEFLIEYGHRAVYEVDLSNPRWREDPGYLLNLIKRNIGGASLPSIKAQQKDMAEQAWQTIKKEVPFHLRLFIKSLVRHATTGAALKEMAKSTYIRLYEPLRLLLHESGRRFVSRGLLQCKDDIFHCAYIEVVSMLMGEWNGEGLNHLIETRRAKKAALEKLSPPDIFLDDQPQYSKFSETDTIHGLVGIGVAAGCAEGLARLIHTPERGVLQPGEVLVAPSTDPAWTPLFLNAVAIAMETGGQLSHGAIVAREYGIPAVVNIAGLFKAVNEGDRLRVNGDQGIVEIVKGT